MASLYESRAGFGPLNNNNQSMEESSFRTPSAKDYPKGFAQHAEAEEAEVLEGRADPQILSCPSCKCSIGFVQSVPRDVLDEIEGLEDGEWLPTDDEDSEN